ncbi:MAG: Ig-like domain-containing protein, partial [Actinomycetota bacterium]|nr:Ig-like domain-containing protein [Actinomycetota bacterium]
VAGREVAHTGNEVDTALRCQLALTTGTSADVCRVRQTPVLDWDPVVGAALYEVYVARDESLTNRVYTPPILTANTRWTPTEMLPDSQAGEAYYWAVRPCKTRTNCAPEPTRATNAVDKTSHDVEIVSPSTGTPVQNAVSFLWKDYLVTNGEFTGNQRSRVEAKQYRVEVSTSSTFQTLLDTATVDQTTYTSATKIYPEGPLHWRVSALDGSGNVVGTSAAISLTKASDPVVLQSPNNGSASPSTPALRWVPRAYTASYDVEVYKDNDTNFSSANRVFSGSTELSAFSLASPLPASALPYVWRVRSKDVSGNAGPWSVARTFTVRGDAPAQVAPAADVRVSATSGLFTWGAVAGTSSYRFERRKSGSATATETVNTVGLAWAPTSKLSDGSWEWRVSTVDPAGKVVATSAWRAFRVDGTAPTVVATTPSSSARPMTNVTATFSEPVRGATTGTMKLFQQGRQHPVSATVSLSATKLKATLNPATNLLVGRTYRAVLTSGITDTARNPLAKREWTFTVTQ